MHHPLDDEFLDLDYLGTDAVKWAHEFCKMARDHQLQVSETCIAMWFANAIQQGRDAGFKEREMLSGQSVANG